ncbi:MAG: glycosyltransferase [Actinobacteria bacterium]|nr:glycosyltransferase [Actinomycetota bacterium]
MPLSEVTVFPRPIADAVDELAQSRSEELLAQIAETSSALEGRVVWHVNTTARGGGVAEMLNSLVGYARGAGIDSRWRVIGGDPRFFEITKRIHNRLHGSAGDGGALCDEARADYESTLAFSGHALRELVSPGDIVVLHDPQTAGLAPLLAGTGAHLVWRCHIGLDEPNAIAEETWSFLRPYVDAADELIFSRPEHVWTGIDAARVRIVPPAIDHRSSKNHWLAPESVDAILRVAEILPAGGADLGNPAFARQSGEAAEVGRRAEMLGIARLDPDLPIVCQVSRWDRLKDPVGVLHGFAGHVLPSHESQLVLAGPSVSAVADDPEQAEVLNELMSSLASLSATVRDRVAIACLPMEDIEENAAIVNALQRRSDVVVQKSLAEGFGLTVSEAMWKGTPVVASGVGGIQDQIEHFLSGMLVDEPTDHATFGEHISLLLREPEFADVIGDGGRERVREEFLVARHLHQDVELYDDLLASEWDDMPFRASA